MDVYALAIKEALATGGLFGGVSQHMECFSDVLLIAISYLDKYCGKSRIADCTVERRPDGDVE
jgi:hypothetical protein